MYGKCKYPFNSSRSKCTLYQLWCKSLHISWTILFLVYTVCSQEVVQLFSLRGIRSVSVYGGVSKLPQEEKLSYGVEICVATPGRLNDLLRSGATNLNRCTFLVRWRVAVVICQTTLIKHTHSMQCTFTSTVYFPARPLSYVVLMLFPLSIRYLMKLTGCWTWGLSHKYVK